METIRKCGSGFKQKEIFFSSSWIFSLEISKSEGVNRNKCKFGVLHVHGCKAQAPAIKDQKSLNIVAPETHFWLFLGTNVQIVKLRGKDRIQTFSGNVRCLFGCPMYKCIYYPGNRKH